MRAALTLAVAFGAALCGCYRSHLRTEVAMDAGSIDAPADAGRDVELRFDVPDAPVTPDCVVSCDPIERVASISVPPAPVWGLSAVTAAAGRIAVVVPDGGGANNYTLAIFDVATGAVAGPQARPGPPWHEPSLTPRGVGPLGDGFVVTALFTDGFASRFPVRGSIEASSYGGDAMLVAPPSLLGELPFEYARCECQLEASIFGRGASWAIAAVDGEELWLTRVEVAPTPRVTSTELLVRFDGAPPRTTPVSGAMLRDGRVVVAGGGIRRDTERREGFLVIEQEVGAPIVTTLPGERRDPPPSIVATDAGISVFRYVTNPDDLDDSRIRAELRDEAGAVLDALDVRPDFGLEPIVTATFADARGGGLAWVEPDSGLRVLPPPGSGSASSWAECPVVATPAVATFETPLEAGGYGSTALLALGPGDGADELYVVAYTHAAFEPVATVELLRVPRCRLDRAR